MEQDKKNQTGAPSSDTTSALFVSARKKQIEQQEAERRAREKEEQRQAAEAEVRRLEHEVEERKRKAEEDARRIAEEARAKRAEAAANPDSVLGAAPQPKETKAPKLPQMPKMPQPAAKPQGGAATAQKPGLNKNILIIGGVAAVVVIAVVLFLVLGNGGRDSGGSADFGGTYISSQKGLDFAYPSDWIVDDASASNVVVTSPELNGFLSIADVTSQINTLTGGGTDIISAAESVITTMSQAVIGDDALDAPPQLQKTGDYVSGSTEFTGNINGTESDVHISLEVIENRAILFMEAVETKNAKKFFPISEEIRMTLGVSAPDPVEADTKEYKAVPDGFSRFTSKNGLTMVYPSGWGISDTNGGFSRPVVQIVAPGNGFMFVINFADESTKLIGQDIYDEFVSQVIMLANFDTNNVEKASDIGYEKLSGGMEEYYQTVEYAGNLKVFVSTIIYNDEDGNIQAVFLVTPKSDANIANSMVTIVDSIEAA